MGIYIKGMEMPKSCYKCEMRRRDGMDIVCPLSHEQFSITDVNILEYRLDSCPLIPVPPHGRCIDADELKALVHANIALFDSAPGKMGAEQKLVRAWLASMADDIEDAPTIIPAEEGE